MFGTSGRVAETMRLIGFCFLIYVCLEVYQVARVAIAESKSAELIALDRSIDPVRLLLLDQRECLGFEFIISGYLDKTEYPGGKEAKFLGMRIYDDSSPPQRLPWRTTSDSDKSNESRRYGEQSIDFIIEGPCDALITVDTIHASPLTGREITMEWGAFYAPL